MVIEVGAPDTEAVYAEALGWSAPDDGLVTVVAPPLVRRASEILALALRAADIEPLSRPPSGDAQVLEIALARLAAHRIDAIVLLHARWIPDAAVRDLVSLLAIAGIELFVVTHPDDEASPVGAWARATWGWPDARSWIAARRPRPGPPADPGRHQRVPMPVLGLVGARPVSGTAARADLAAARASTGRLAGAHSAHLAATVARRALRDGISVVALAHALADDGYLLLEGTADARPPEWRDLRRIEDPAAAAAVTLATLGLRRRESAALGPTDIAPDGALVTLPRGAVSVAPAARPYLLAQRRIRIGLASQLLSAGGHPVTPSGADTLVIEGLRQIGRSLDRADLAGGLRPSQRWLFGQGLVVRRTRFAPDPVEHGDRAAGPRRCRHALPDWIGVPSAGGVSHSQLLCRARETEEVRPPEAGYRLEELERCGDAVAYAIHQMGRRAGSAWRVPTPLGPAWVQSMTVPPPLDAVAAAVRAAQMGR